MNNRFSSLSLFVMLLISATWANAAFGLPVIRIGIVRDGPVIIVRTVYLDTYIDTIYQVC